MFPYCAAFALGMSIRFGRLVTRSEKKSELARLGLDETEPKLQAKIPHVTSSQLPA